MLVRLGERTPQGDAVDLLAACHERIRRFLALAHRLATEPGDPSDIASVAALVRRYFAVALPLHVADEECEIVPRLRGTSDDVDRALAAIHAEHAAHEAGTARLVELCDTLVQRPEYIDAIRFELAAVAAALSAELDPHLELEERVIFPALRALPADAREAIADAMRARRG